MKKYYYHIIGDFSTCFQFYGHVQARIPDILQVYVFDAMQGLIEHKQRYSTVHTVFSGF